MKEIKRVLDRFAYNVQNYKGRGLSENTNQAEAEIKKIVAGEYKSGYHDALNGRPFRKGLL